MKKSRITVFLCFMVLSIGLLMAKDLKKVVFNVPQMMCENCEKKVKDNIRFEKGVKDIVTDIPAKTVAITYDADKTDVQKLQEGFKKFNYEATCAGGQEEGKEKTDCIKNCCSK